MFNLNKIKDNIESLPHYQQLLIVQHMMNNKINFTENQNGIFLDISILQDREIEIIQDFLLKIKLEEEKFNAVENKKAELKKQIELNCNIVNET